MTLQREIKFRAWDKKEKKMYYVDELIWFNDGRDLTRVVCGCEVRNYRYLQMPDDVELMQFTGLHDKNGKEIYEGDILKEGQYTLEPMIVFWDRGLCSFELKTKDENTFEHLLDLLGENDLGYILWEVIGNIYENKNLLKK